MTGRLLWLTWSAGSLSIGAWQRLRPRPSNSTGKWSTSTFDIDISDLLEDPETAQMACTILERLSGGDRQLAATPTPESEVIDAEAVDLDEE